MVNSSPPNRCFWSEPAAEVIAGLGTSADGLDETEIRRRLELYGLNTIAEAVDVSAWQIWWRQFRSLIVALLIVAAAISFSIGEHSEGIAVLAVVLINSLIGFFTELKANNSMAALKKMSQMSARVKRCGKAEYVNSSDLVPGDWVVLDAGDMVPADIRITEANSLQSDESALTGESLPIRKTVEALDGDTPLAERKSMLYRGAKITAGTGAGVVVETGGNSELGKISTMVRGAAHHATPLEKQLDRLGYRLVWITLALMVVMTMVGAIQGIDLLTMVQTSIALAIAAIPEGLPVVATIALANGLWKMAENNAIINQLSAVETLGSTGVICTDKTGTLTENRMTVSALWPSDMNECIRPGSSGNESETVRRMMAVSALCNNADVGEGRSLGDPLEVALLEWVQNSGLDIKSVKEANPRSDEIPFDAVARKMTTVHTNHSGGLTAVKGAAEALLAVCHFEDGKAAERNWERRNLQMARQGLRVIAVAEGSRSGASGDGKGKLTFLGLIGLIDPPRSGISKAVSECRSAGIRIVMITGDQAPTARAVADRIGLEEGESLTGTELNEIDLTTPAGISRMNDVRIIARATPAQKMTLVKHYQNQDHIVAMTGDGVNDAPALKQADIGVAMGLRGTDVAREAASMVLQDDSFSSIVVAIRQGRIILKNIRKFVIYLMSCNISEILVVWISMMITNQLPLLPLQILFLNLVTDVFPALALGVTPGDGSTMSQSPRKAGDSILKREDWIKIFRHGITISLATLGSFMFAIYDRQMPAADAVTISFLTLAVAQLFHVFNMAEEHSSFIHSEVVKNRWVWGALLLCAALLACACYIPPLTNVLGIRPPGPGDLLLISGFASIPLLIEWAKRFFQKVSWK